MEITRPVEPGDAQLVESAKAGDRKAFEVLVERYKQKAYRIAFHHTRDREEAKDLSQEAFVRAFTQLKSFDLRSSFYTWFYRILTNLCIDYQRKRRRIAWIPFKEKEDQLNSGQFTGSNSVSPDQQLSAQEMSRKVETALKQLPEKQRAAFILRNHEGLSIQEIANIMGSAEGTIKVHLHRAVMALRQTLAEFA